MPDPRRRLAFVLKSSDLGGTQKYVLELCRRLDRSLYDIEVVTSSGGPLIGLLDELGIPVHVVEIPRYRISAVADWKALHALTRLFRERRYDIVHPHNAKPGFLGRYAARRAGVPIIVFTYHLIPFHERVSPPARLIYRKIDTWLARHATTRMIAVAHHHRRTLVAQGVCREEDIEVIWNGLQAPEAPPSAEERGAARGERLACSADSPVVAFIGRLMPQKDPLTYVRAVARCHARGARAQFLLIGDGELMPECRDEARNLGLNEEKLRFVGERRDVPQLLPGVDLLVLPSLWEGLPFSLLEAMVAAVPIVCSRIPGNDEVVVEGETGRLVPPRDPDALAEAILAMLSDPDGSRRMGLAGHERLRTHFSLDAMVKKTAAVYERLWQEKMSPRS
jgi:glycosyltransferase involved in cell wall biosynthesis